MLWRSFLIISSLLFSSQALFAQDTVRILSLDGGGVRGIIEAVVLMAIEDELEQPIAEIFDMVAGTSTGGIIALGLVAPGPDGRPRYSAREILDVYFEYSNDIFSSSFCHKIKTLGGLIGPKHDCQGMEALARYFLSDTMLSEAIIPVLVTAYHVEGETGVEFSSEAAKEYPDMDCLMRHVGQATAAAPTYFPLVTVDFSWGSIDHLADGALYKTNPALLAYVEAKKRFPNSKIEIYSIGSGLMHDPAHCTTLKSGGLLHWIASIIHHLQTGDSEADNDLLHKLLNEDNERRFFRLNMNLKDYNASMDDASLTNMRFLNAIGHRTIQSPVFREMLERLKMKSLTQS